MFGTLLRTELLIWFRTKENLFWAIAWPLFWILLVWGVFPPLPNRTRVETLQYFYPGGILLIIFSASLVSLAIKLASAKEQKELLRLKLVPMSIWTFFVGQLLASGVFTTIAILVFTIVGYILGIRLTGSLFSGAAVVALAMLAFSSLAFLIAGITHTVSQANILSMLVMFLMMFLSNAFFDLSGAPLAMRVTRFLPATPVCDALRGILVYGRPLWEQLGSIAVIAVWAIVGSTVSVSVFKVQ